MWADLKKAIASVIKTNNNQEITGQVLQNTLNSIVDTVGENATFAGIATPDTNPGVPDGPVFYLNKVFDSNAIYANFGNITINAYTFCALLWHNKTWDKYVITTFPMIVHSTGTSTTDIMSQKAVTNELSKKINKEDIVQELGDSAVHIMSQKAVNDAIATGIVTTLSPIYRKGVGCLYNTNTIKFIDNLDYSHKIYVIAPGDKVYIKAAPNANCVIRILRRYPVELYEGVKIDIVEGILEKTNLIENDDTEFVASEECRYLYHTEFYAGKDYSPAIIKINDKTVFERSISVIDEIKDIKHLVDSIYINANNAVSYDLYKAVANHEGNGYLYSNVFNHTGDKRYAHILFFVTSGDEVYIKTKKSVHTIVRGLKSYPMKINANTSTELIEDDSINIRLPSNSEKTFIVPEEMRFLYFSKIHNGVYYDPEIVKINGKTVYKSDISNNILDVIENNKKPSIIIRRVDANNFSLDVLDEKTGKYIEHTFTHSYYTKDYTINSITKTVVCADVWYHSRIFVDGERIAYGNTNFIYKLNNYVSGFEDENCFVGAGHGCAMSYYTKFFIDGKEINPTDLKETIYGEKFRFVEKVKCVAGDSSVTGFNSDKVTPKLNANGSYIITAEHFLDLTIEKNNILKRYNKLTVKRDGIKFSHCYGAMMSVDYSKFSNFIVNNEDNSWFEGGIKNGSVFITPKGNTSDISKGDITSDAYLFGDSVIAFGKGITFKTSMQSKADKPNLRVWFKYPNNTNPYGIKFYYQPIITNTSLGEVKTYNSGDCFEVEAITEISLSND